MKTRLNLTAVIVLSGLLVSLFAVPSSGAQERATARNTLLDHLSQSVAIRYWLANPDQAPAQIQRRLKGMRQAAARLQASSAPPSEVADVFNHDTVGFPQNEEDVTVCRSQPNIVLGATNDYRGLLDPQENFTGWHLSRDGGGRAAREGLLPSVEIAGNQVPSGGDPVVASDGDCVLFAASLNYDPIDPFGQPNGIGVYVSDPQTLNNCPGGSDPACWPIRRAVAETTPPHFLDKEWMDAGLSGDAGQVVWATYSDFINDETAPLGFTSASIYAVRCSADLSQCTDPILISGDDLDVQFSDVTVGPDGRTYITWSEIQGELEQTAQTFIHKLRIAPAGSTEFGPEQIIHTESLAIPFGGVLHANDFRIATYPKHEVVMVDDHPRIFVVWDACLARPLDTICEEPQIKLSYSDNDGASWSAVQVLSENGDNYFPAIAGDPTSGLLAVTWFTNRYDEIFHNRQDVELAILDASSVNKLSHVRVTSESNETEADPLLGGFFIGDYIGVDIFEGTSYVHYNANYRHRQLLGQDFPIPQQDNYLTRVGLGQ